MGVLRRMLESLTDNPAQGEGTKHGLAGFLPERFIKPRQQGNLLVPQGPELCNQIFYLLTSAPRFIFIKVIVRDSRCPI